MLLLFPRYSKYIWHSSFGIHRFLRVGAPMRQRRRSSVELSPEFTKRDDRRKKSKASNICCCVILLFVSIPCFIAMMNFIAWRLAKKELVSDETVEILPSYGYQLKPEDPFWTLHINAVVYRSGNSDYLKRMFLDTMVSFLSSYYAEYDISVLRNRFSLFLRDFQRGKYVNLSVCFLDPHLYWKHCKSTESAASLVSIGPTQEDGLVNSKLQIKSLDKYSNKTEVFVYTDGRKRIEPTSIGQLQDRIARLSLIPYDGLSVISDIDDTIKTTNVGNVRKVLEATFFKDFMLVPEVFNLYNSWLTGMDGSIHFHYVSSSPWLLANLLFDWIKTAKLPVGSIHLKKFRLELFEPWGIDLSLLNLFKSPVGYKIKKIKNILLDFPGRIFILVGDSSEKDPEIYGQIAREYPDQIICTLIRNCPHRLIDRIDPKRLERAFYNVPSIKYGLVTAESSTKGHFFDIKSMLKSRSCAS